MTALNPHRRKNARIRELECELHAAGLEIARLKQALETYGGHNKICPAEYEGEPTGRECTCGYSAALGEKHG